MLTRVIKRTTVPCIVYQSRPDEEYTAENLPDFVTDPIDWGTCNSSLLEPLTDPQAQVDVVGGEVVITP
jgi:hypothetical protein